MMMLFVPIALVLLGAEPSASELPDRTATRFRGAFSVVGAAGYAFPNAYFNLAPGLSAEAGVTFNDTVSVVARGTFATLLTRSVIHAGASIDLVLSDRLSLGVGLAFSMLGALVGEDLPSTIGLSLPFRASWMFRKRPEGERARQGFFVFLEAAPGLALASASGLPTAAGIAPRPFPSGPPFLLSGVVGVGYAVW